MRHKYGVNELRKMFLDFFESKGHLIMKSFSLVPHNDNSLLLINAGMAPLKPYFTKQEIPPRNRVATCQKCIRTGDIENVGKTDRHGTFFEMLGNFSFGDYFKHEAIAWSWEFLTEVVGLEADRLYPSVYEEDNEAFDIWQNEIGIAPERIFRFGKEDNFWEHGAGPCGPCSEIYYDRGEKYGCGRPGCTVGCDCDRYMEIWNNVFTQFENDGHGNYELLKSKNIDTGMGLERLASVVQDVDSIFDVDTLLALRREVCSLSNKEYKKDFDTDVSIRLITDHIRSVTFLVSDGVMPSNEGRGYVLRRLLRRAARHGRKLGINGRFLAELSKKVIEVSESGYPELTDKQEYIYKVIDQEEQNFNKTIDQGLKILSDYKNELVKSGKKELSGIDAFRLHDTYGFPLDLTEEVLTEDGFTVDRTGFENEMKNQKETARKARKITNYMGADSTVYDKIDPSITSEFVGYDNYSADSDITVICSETDLVDSIEEGQTGTIICKETPFYATSGGQEADTGIIINGESEFTVDDTIKLKGGKIAHVGTVSAGSFKVGDKVTLKVDKEKRDLTARNHSATHLLQKALRTVLGSHVQQKGSSVNEDRLRFDFSHFSALTKDELTNVEKLVNEAINADYSVKTDIMNLDDARKTGAMALFGEKYDQNVRVVSMGDSKEFCGGTHVKNTGAISQFKILSEAAVSAGVRRIEAITSKGVNRFYKGLEDELSKACSTVKSEPSMLIAKLESLMAELKELSSENESLKSKLANHAVGNVEDNIKEINGVKFIAIAVKDVDMNGLMNLGDQMKEKLGDGVVVIISDLGSKVSLLAMATENAVKSGAHAGNLIKGIAPIVGGGGGGRPNMAQAGGKNPAGINKALAAVEGILRDQIK